VFTFQWTSGITSTWSNFMVRDTFGATLFEREIWTNKHIIFSLNVCKSSMNHGKLEHTQACTHLLPVAAYHIWTLDYVVWFVMAFICGNFMLKATCDEIIMKCHKGQWAMAICKWGYLDIFCWGIRWTGTETAKHSLFINFCILILCSIRAQPCIFSE
jgi:hypothetical protein